MRPDRRQFVLGSLGAAACCSPPPRPPSPPAYPERPITFICPWPAGGTADVTMRALCQVAAKELGQPIVVENKAGASGMLGPEGDGDRQARRLHHRPDPDLGDALLAARHLADRPAARTSPTSPAPPARPSASPCSPKSPFKTLKDMVAHAKANPGKVTYAHAGIGGATHVGMEEFALAAGIQLNAIAYKGGAPALHGHARRPGRHAGRFQLVGAARRRPASCACWPPGARSARRVSRTCRRCKRAGLQGRGRRAQRHRRAEGPATRQSRRSCATPSGRREQQRVQGRLPTRSTRR